MQGCLRSYFHIQDSVSIGFGDNSRSILLLLELENHLQCQS